MIGSVLADKTPLPEHKVDVGGTNKELVYRKMVSSNVFVARTMFARNKVKLRFGFSKSSGIINWHDNVCRGDMSRLHSNT